MSLDFIIRTKIKVKTLETRLRAHFVAEHNNLSTSFHFPFGTNSCDTLDQNLPSQEVLHVYACILIAPHPITPPTSGLLACPPTGQSHAGAALCYGSKR